MARVVVILDSATGQLIDVAGNAREGARYSKFVNRLLSLDTNPTLNYGGNGGDTLTISKGGYAGAEIRLLADKVTVSGDLTVGGKALSEIIEESSVDVLGNVIGTDDEITVKKVYITDESSGDVREGIQIALSDTVTDKIADLDESMRGLTGYVKKSDLAGVVEDLEVKEDATLEDVKDTLRTLLARIADLAS